MRSCPSASPAELRLTVSPLLLSYRLLQQWVRSMHFYLVLLYGS